MLVHMLGTRLKFSTEEPLKTYERLKKQCWYVLGTETKCPIKRGDCFLEVATNNTIGLLFIPLEAFQG